MSRLAHYLHQLRTLPPREVARRLAAKVERRTRGVVEELRGRAGLLFPSSGAFCREVGIAPAEAAKWIEKFREDLRTRGPCSARTIAASPGEWSGILGREAGEKLTAAARDAVEHRFDLLGSGPVVVGLDPAADRVARMRHLLEESTSFLGESAATAEATVEGTYRPIDWHTDFKSCFRWGERVWFARIAYGRSGADIKVPWELSRFAHGIRLGQAFRLTGEAKFAREVVLQILDWIAANPVGFGPNWTTPMDIAIRAATWTTSLQLIAESAVLTPAVLWLIARSLEAHGRHIMAHLEWHGDDSSNHYISDIAGLSILATACPALPGAGEWARYARERLASEIERQVYADGCDFEASTAYHRLVLELFLMPYIQATRVGFPFGERYRERLKAMLDALRALLHDDGTAPQFGDNDSGRFLAFETSGTAPLSMGYLLALGDAALATEPGGLRPSGSDVSAALWLADRPPPEPDGPLWRARRSAAMRDAGWFVLREGGLHVAISAGPNGRPGRGSHTHNDKLSFELSAGGVRLIADPGTFLYTPAPEKRNLYRSTAMHNTLAVAGWEQNRWLEGPLGLFSVLEAGEVRTLDFAEKLFRGEYKGFAVRHEREFRLGAGRLDVKDRIETGGRAAWLHWHFAPGVEAVAVAAGRVDVRAQDIRAVLEVHSGTLEVYRSSYSAGYGLEEKSRAARIAVADGEVTWSIRLAEVTG